MAVESPLLHLGWLTISTSQDARRSSITGTTLNGPNGSAQFSPMFTSTVTSLVAAFTTSAIIPSSIGASFIGILQNTPGPGQVADIGFIGPSKAIAGATFAVGAWLQPSSSTGTYVVQWAVGAGQRIGYALETVTSAGQVFSMMLFPQGST